MSLDSFFSKYVAGLHEAIAHKQQTIARKDFKKLSEFSKVQGQLQGLEEALQLLQAIPEDD